MDIVNELTPKNRRIIERDLNVFSSPKGYLLIGDIDGIKSISPFNPKMTIKEVDFYLSPTGIGAIRRISEVLYSLFNCVGDLNFDNVSQVVFSEVSRCIDNDEPLIVADFVGNVIASVSEIIRDYEFFCRIDGVFLDGISDFSIGDVTIAPYSPALIADRIKDSGKEIQHHIDEEYSGSLVVVGCFKGVKDVALEKFYYNAELSLSLLRLYACALKRNGLRCSNIRLINSCEKNYGPASSFFFEKKGGELTFKKYFKSFHDFNINPDFVDYARSNLFWERFSSLIASGGSNEIENAILKSIFWVGEAQKEKTNAASFIKLWSAIECFFSFNDDQISEKNARGVAAVIVFGGFFHEQYHSYKELKALVKKYYSYRSKIVHRADFLHITDSQVCELSYISSWLIITMFAVMDRGYTKLEEIRNVADWLDKQNEKS